MSLISYPEIRKRQTAHYLHQYEVPVESAVSFPLPTNRWERPAYAFFAAKALRKPGQPVLQSKPDRWWLVDAHDGKLLLYALDSVLSFSDPQSLQDVELPHINRSLAEHKALIADMELLMTVAADAFFNRLSLPDKQRKSLVRLLDEVLPAPLVTHYQALTPDFFIWLGWQ